MEMMADATRGAVPVLQASDVAVNGRALCRGALAIQAGGRPVQSEAPRESFLLEIPGELEYKQAKPVSHRVNYSYYSVNKHTQKALLQTEV